MWIPVTERRPNEDQWALVYGPAGTVPHMDIAQFDGLGWWTATDGHVQEFTHWMPLPEPPK